MKAALDKMMAEEDTGAGMGADADLSEFDNEVAEVSEDKKLEDALAGVGYIGLDPTKLAQIKDILGAGSDPLGGAGANPPSASTKPKSKMDSLFGGAKL